MWIDIPDDKLAGYITLLQKQTAACGLSKNFVFNKKQKQEVDNMIAGLGELSTILIKAENGRFCSYCRENIDLG